MNKVQPGLVFVHGWGFDAGFWRPLRRLLCDYDCHVIDLGFRSAPSHPELSGPLVGIGHSLGFPWLLKNRPFQWKGLVAINSFPRFVRGDGFPSGAPEYALEKTMAGLQKNTEATMAEFLGRCGSDEKSLEWNYDRLYQGLKWLSSWDMRREMDQQRLLALAGRQDPIVFEAMTMDGFAGRNGVELNWCDGGHLLPLSNPEWCAKRISKWIADL